MSAIRRFRPYRKPLTRRTCPHKRKVVDRHRQVMHVCLDKMTGIIRMRFYINANNFKARPLHADARAAPATETDPMLKVYALDTSFLFWIRWVSPLVRILTLYFLSILLIVVSPALNMTANRVAPTPLSYKSQISLSCICKSCL